MSGGDILSLGPPCGARFAHMDPRPRKTGSRAFAVQLALSALWLVHATAAHAATVSASGGVLTFVAAAGESNFVQFVLVDPGALGQSSGSTRRRRAHGRLGVHACRAGLAPSPPAGASRANCGNVTSANVSLGNMDDIAWLGTRRTAQDPQVAAVLDGGPGNDALLGGPLTDSYIKSRREQMMRSTAGRVRTRLSADIGGNSYSLTECSGSPCLPTTDSDTVSGGDGMDSTSFNSDIGVAGHSRREMRTTAPWERTTTSAPTSRTSSGLARPDVLSGNDQPNVIDGGGGDGDQAGDTLNGLGGNDTLHTNNPFRSTLNEQIRGDDHLYSARTLNGGDGDDCFFALVGRLTVAATVTENSGINTVDYGT